MASFRLVAPHLPKPNRTESELLTGESSPSDLNETTVSLTGLGLPPLFLSTSMSLDDEDDEGADDDDDDFGDAPFLVEAFFSNLVLELFFFDITPPRWLLVLPRDFWS